MKVRMKVDLSGNYNGRPWPRRGEIAQVEDMMGAKLCSTGLAESVGDHQADIENAVKTEDSEKRRGRPPKPRDADGNIIREG